MEKWMYALKNDCRQVTGKLSVAAMSSGIVIRAGEGILKWLPQRQTMKIGAMETKCEIKGEKSRQVVEYSSCVLARSIRRNP